MDNVLRKLSQETFLQGTDQSSFASRAGFFLGEINAVHPFREGNGRTQREFIRELGLHAGFIIDWSRVTQDKMMVASRESFRSGDSSGLVALIQTSII